MMHPDRKKAKRYDMPGRCREFTDLVYSGVNEDPRGLWARIRDTQNKFDPPAPEYKAFIGEVHGHSRLSDGGIDPETYYPHLRDEVGLDFGALTDHDHGGVGKPELWVGSPSKWQKMQELAKRNTIPGKFSAILAYERDSYPFYNNMILYFRSHDAEMVRGVRDGEITEEELRALLARDDVVCSPHDTYYLSSGADFEALEPSLITPLMEIYSRADAAEYLGNPGFAHDNACEGGFLQDALRRGARIGVVAGSDDHNGRNGVILEDQPYPWKFPGLTGIWAAENTPDALFEGLRARRTYAFMGGRIKIDFRINGHWMGEEFTRSADEELRIFYNIEADAPIRSITLVKNCRNYMCFYQKPAKQLVFDYRQEQETDSYYLRLELEDGRFGWTSPIFVTGV